MKTLEIKEAATEIVEVPLQKEAEPESAPSVIEIVISEVDRQTADDYCQTGTCLIATALMNRGYNVTLVGISCCYIRSDDGYRSLGSAYCFDRSMTYAELYSSPSTKKPFYGPEVVGKKVTLIKA